MCVCVVWLMRYDSAEEYGGGILIDDVGCLV